MNAGTILRHARVTAGLTQQQLAARLGVTQGAVAQLERADANPTIATLERALGAAQHRLELQASRAAPSVDVSLLREAQRMTPAQRIAAGDRLLRDAERLARAGRRRRR